jgi:zinc-binding alcohol dehydrogenase family protein
MTDTMRAIGFRRSLPVTDPESLLEVELPRPAPGPHDLLVRVEAVSVNPADAKVRAAGDPEDVPKVLGYDAAGVVEAVGAEVSLFRAGDEVYYAGNIARPGTNAEYHLVDERITGHKPASLDFAAAAALPLTTITAWETLFDRLRLGKDSTGTLVVMAAAGGVGSMVVQLARRLTGLTVIGTASRPESAEWVTGLGAHHVVDHHGDLVGAVRDIAPHGADYVFSPFSAGNVQRYADLMGVGGQVVAIDEPEGLDTLPLKSKSQAWHWELMFTRPMFETPDMIEQKHLLSRVAGLVDELRLRTTLTESIADFSAAGLRRAHELVESGRMTGKVVVHR